MQIDGFRSGYNGTVIINVDCAGASVVNMPQARVVIGGQLQATSEVMEILCRQGDLEFCKRQRCYDKHIPDDGCSDSAWRNGQY